MKLLRQGALALTTKIIIVIIIIITKRVGGSLCQQGCYVYVAGSFVNIHGRSMRQCRERHDSIFPATASFCMRLSGRFAD
uniref:Uncharacterized protein n=1 Tax=Octopus bimaculoides TaxID=37653 RepID=A0A0L8GK35_OCTBM